MDSEKENRIVKRTLSLTGILLLLWLSTSISYGQIKWAQTGFNFLSVSSDARSGAMGDAVNSLSGYSGALFHNPASMAEMPTLLNASFDINSWIADIDYLSFQVSVSPFKGEYGVLGISFQSIDYGDVQGTMWWPSDNGYVDTDVMNPSAMAFGIGYAKMITDQFGIGAQVRFAYQSLGKSVVPSGAGYAAKQNVANAVSYDFGTIFKTGIESLTFGMSIRNFSQEVRFEQEGFQLPLLFTFGVSADVFDFMSVPGPEQSLLISCDATHPRSHPEQLKIGLEYSFMKMIFLRGGYITNNSEDGITYGLGVTSEGLGITSAGFELDYSYTPFGVFDNVQRFSVNIFM
jgi:hypothetical protein